MPQRRNVKDNEIGHDEDLRAQLLRSSDGMVISRADGQILDMNDAARALLEVGSEARIAHQSYQVLLADYEFYDEELHMIPLEQLPMLNPHQGQSMYVLVHYPSGHERDLDLTTVVLTDQRGEPGEILSIFHRAAERQQQEIHLRRVFHTLASLVEYSVQLPLDDSQPNTHSLPMVGQRLTDIIYQILDAAVVCLTAIEMPEKRISVMGVSGMPDHLVNNLHEVLGSTTLDDYMDAASINSLANNEVVIRNIDMQAILRRARYGQRNILLAPMLLDQHLIGILVISRPAGQGYTQEEIELMKAIAKLATMVVERTRILRGWAQSSANELALQEANRRFDVFLSIASHELRTPLTGIKGNIQLVLRRLEKMGQQGDKLPIESQTERIQIPLQECIRRATMLDRMIGDMLDASRIQANNFSIMPRPTNAVQVLREAVEDLQRVMTDREIFLELPTEQVIMVNMDADRIIQVINNFLVNALKFSMADRPVTATMHVTEKGWVHVAVRDEGPGLSEEEQQHIWERFYQVQGTEVQYGSGKGLGLGLYLCAIIIQAHHGTIGVQSAKGKGATFWFELPRIEEAS